MMGVSFDIINSLFELAGTPFVLLSILKVCKNKSSKGVAWCSTGFFSAWGIWNLFYYPELEQTFSFVAGSLLALSNTVWLILLIKYRKS